MTEEIRVAIEADGPIPFERFMELALYGEQGFDTPGGRAGLTGNGRIVPRRSERTQHEEDRDS